VLRFSYCSYPHAPPRPRRSRTLLAPGLLASGLLLLLCAACSKSLEVPADAAPLDGLAGEPLPLDAPVSKGIPLLCDVDMGLDDARVIVSLPMQDRFRVLGVVTVEGSSGAKKGADNALRLLAALGVDTVPVAIGATEALKGAIAAPAWRSMCEGLGGLSLSAAKRKPETATGAAFIVEALKKSAQPVRILAIGPLTNVALALASDSSIAKKIHSISVLGDFLTCTSYNCSTDEDAAKAVFASGVPISMVLSSAATQAPFDATFLAKVQALKGTPGKLVSQFMASHADGYMKLWDDAVLAGLLDSSILTTQTVKTGLTEATDLDASKLETLLLTLWNRTAPVMP
jgi:purine nucleosidase